MTFPDRNTVRALARPKLAELFAAQGQAATLHPGGGLDVWNGGATPPPAAPIAVRAILNPVSDHSRAVAQGQGLPMPSVEVYLPWATPGSATSEAPDGVALPVDAPGWTLTLDGRSYRPVQDARNEMNYNLVWIVPMRGAS